MTLGSLLRTLCTSTRLFQSSIPNGDNGWAVYHGLRHDNDITKGFGLTFLGINLYTRFFELFWDNLHKAIFFALLGASFWYIGSKAETIWNLGKREENIPAR